MDMSEKDKFGVENRSGDHLNYQSSDLSSSEWQFGNQPLAIVSPNPSIAVRQGTQMGSSPSPSSVSMVDSFHSTLWNQPTNSSSLGGIFMQTGSNTLPPSLSNFPTDSAFIERAARFSCFNGRNFSGVSNPFGRSEPLSPYSNASRGDPGDQNRESESPTEDQRCKGSLRGVGVLSNEPGEPEFSECVQEETAILSSVAGDGKKRKRTNQDIELDQVEGGQQLSVETSKENSSTMETPKLAGKQAKDSSDSPKEDYIHVRARRGQATNSHSLAERVRREKISERMKFLQDLVPGCSKVTGKAVMLDEIINYVQSLQRQVEFLSMKLATVNQRLDINIEGILSKDFIQSRIGSSSTMGFSHDMIHPQLRPPQYGLVQGGMSSATHLPEALRRAINVPLTMPSGYKEHTPQIPGSWDEELHNVFQMNLGSNPTLDATQELTAAQRSSKTQHGGERQGDEFEGITRRREIGRRARRNNTTARDRAASC